MNVTVIGIDKAVQRIEKYVDMRAKLAEIAERLCKIGEPIIKRVHGNHSAVWTEPTDSGFRIIAEGEDVLFIEFGAGEDAGSDNSKYDAVPSVAKPGTWSEAHQGEYWRTGGPGVGHWHFGGREINTVPTSPAFYYAYEYMVQNLRKIAEEVLDK